MSILLLALEPSRLTSEQVQQVEALAGGRTVKVTDKREEIEALLPDIEIAAGHFPHELVERAPKLRWFQQWGAGADWLQNCPAAVEKDFILTNASGVHAINIAEHILAFLLAFARSLPNSIRAQQRHEWLRGEGKHVFELAGKVLLLVGVGAIGKRTAQVAAALGMRVWGVRRNPEQTEPGIERMVGQNAFRDLLPEADFVVLTVPETAETRHMIDAAALAQMKPSAYLVNIGRGGTVDEAALIEALQNRQIAGAGLDVFASEPLPPDSPLWDIPNVIITAHYSGLTPEYQNRAMQIFLDNLERYTQNQPLVNEVDKRLGY